MAAIDSLIITPLKPQFRAKKRALAKFGQSVSHIPSGTHHGYLEGRRILVYEAQSIDALKQMGSYGEHNMKNWKWIQKKGYKNKLGWRQSVERSYRPYELTFDRRKPRIPGFIVDPVQLLSSTEGEPCEHETLPSSSSAPQVLGSSSLEEDFIPLDGSTSSDMAIAGGYPGTPLVEGEQEDSEMTPTPLPVPRSDAARGAYADESRYSHQDEHREADILVVTDSDNESSNEQDNVDKKPLIDTNDCRWCEDPYPVDSPLCLTLEEAYFLSYGLGCLLIYKHEDDEHAISLRDFWIYCMAEDRMFLGKYIVYHYYRSRCWVVKTGQNYGVDFVLYKAGPSVYHSAYGVIVRWGDDRDGAIANDNFYQRGSLCRSLLHVAKELLICTVVSSRKLSSKELSLPDCLKYFKVQELHWLTWFSGKARIADGSTAEEDNT